MRSIPTGLGPLTSATHLPLSQKLVLGWIGPSVVLYDTTSYER
jgi:hypothetical protein